MTKIVIDKAMLEQVLNCCEIEPNNEKALSAYDALRAALVEPAVEPDRYAWYQYMDHGNGMGWIERMAAYDPRMPEYAEMYHQVDWVDTKQVRNFRALYTSPTPPAEALAEPAVEPVAWQGVHDSTDLYYRKPPQADVRPLYTSPSPPAEVPLLTDEEIAEIASTPCAVVGSYVHTFARAIEQAVRQKAGL